MRTTWLGHGVVVGAVVAMTALAACGESGGDSASASNSNSTGASDGSTAGTPSETEGTMSGSLSETEPTEGGVSASGTGTTEQSGSMSDSETMGGGSGNETEGMSGGTGQESQGGSGGSTTEMTTDPPPQTTGEPVDCGAAATKDECLAFGCLPIEGQPFEFDGAIWCLNDAASFLGCLQPMPCDAVITTVCKGQSSYQLPDGCFPNGYKTCEPPPDPGMDGYPAC